MEINSKNEVKHLFEKYQVTKKIDNTQDEDMIAVINHLETDAVQYERPDAYMPLGKFIYAVEHFCISQYKKNKNSDLSMEAEGIKKHRENLRKDKDFSLAPSLENLFNSLQYNLKNHSNNFSIYKKNVLELDKENRTYRLVILIEEVTSSWIVKKRDVNPVNPLNLSTVVETLLKYQESVWGIIYVYGNERDKCMTGYTMEELKTLKETGNTLPAENYAPFEVGRNIHVSKDNAENDTNNVTIILHDSFVTNDELFHKEENL